MSGIVVGALSLTGILLSIVIGALSDRHTVEHCLFAPALVPF